MAKREHDEVNQPNIDTKLLIWVVHLRDWQNSELLIEGRSFLQPNLNGITTEKYSGSAWFIETSGKTTTTQIELTSCLVDGKAFETWDCKASFYKASLPCLLTDNPGFETFYNGRITFESTDDWILPMRERTFSYVPVYGENWIGLLSRKWDWKTLWRKPIWNLIAFSNNGLAKPDDIGDVIGQTDEEDIVIGRVSRIHNL